MEILTGDFKQGLSQLLAQTHVQGIVLGTRRWGRMTGVEGCVESSAPNATFLECFALLKSHGLAGILCPSCPSC